MSLTEAPEAKPKEGFSSRKVFIFAAIGSAVGLGNIWRFPYVAYEGGGGAFIIPHLCALLFAGIPLLYLDYAIGHRFRGSAPLSLAGCTGAPSGSAGGRCSSAWSSPSTTPRSSLGGQVHPAVLHQGLG